MKKIARGVTIFCNIANVICIVAIAVTMLAVFADVIMRFVFTNPIPGVTELTQCCFVIMAMSFGVVVLENANTMVDVFTEKMHPQVKRIVELIMDLAAIVFSVVVGWRTIIKAISSADSNIMYVMLGIKEWPVMTIFGIAFFVCTIAAIMFTVKEWISNTELCRQYKLNGGKKKKEESEEG